MTGWSGSMGLQSFERLLWLGAFGSLFEITAITSAGSVVPAGIATSNRPQKKRARYVSCSGLSWKLRKQLGVKWRACLPTQELAPLAASAEKQTQSAKAKKQCAGWFRNSGNGDRSGQIAAQCPCARLKLGSCVI